MELEFGVVVFDWNIETSLNAFRGFLVPLQRFRLTALQLWIIKPVIINSKI